MLTFEVHAVSAATPQDVWKLLYDPFRFPEWWVGFETIEIGPEQDGSGFTVYPTGYPDFPMPQLLTSIFEDRTVKISCLVSDLRFEWRLTPSEDGGQTRISAHVEIPEREAHRLTTQQDVIRRSVHRLAELAAAGG